MNWYEFKDEWTEAIWKEKWKHIYIEAKDQEAAVAVFKDKIGRDPLNISCECCGVDYSIRSTTSDRWDKPLNQLTGKLRRCHFENLKLGFLERPSRDFPTDQYMTIEEFSLRADIMVISAKKGKVKKTIKKELVGV